MSWQETCSMQGFFLDKAWLHFLQVEAEPNPSPCIAQLIPPARPIDIVDTLSMQSHKFTEDSVPAAFNFWLSNGMINTSRARNMVLWKRMRAIHYRQCNRTHCWLLRCSTLFCCSNKNQYHIHRFSRYLYVKNISPSHKDCGLNCNWMSRILHCHINHLSN